VPQTSGCWLLCARFLDVGFYAEEADLRATATFAFGVGFLHLSGPKPNAGAAAITLGMKVSRTATE
jgi:hypothetical protein